jgi:hypothetical protein
MKCFRLTAILRDNINVVGKLKCHYLFKNKIYKYNDNTNPV